MTTTPTLDPEFAGAVRAELVATGIKKSSMQRHQRRTRALAVGVVALAVGGAITGAAVVANLPGTTSVAPAGSPVTVTRTGTATIELGTAASGSNSVILDVTCVSGSGTVSVPSVPGVSNDASGKAIPAPGPDTVQWNCAKRSTTVHIPDGYLAPGRTSITITADPSTTWKAVAQYGRSTTTAWGVNAHGQTYGVDNKENGVPDLESALATNGAVGYILTKDLMAFRGSGYINVYESDGTTVIGKFPIGDVDGWSSTFVTDPPTPPAG